MKLAVLLVALASLSMRVYANPCVAGSLASYEALGAAGCTIGTNLVSAFTSLPGTTGGTEIDPADISIMPSGGTSSPQLLFTLSQSASTSLLEALFTYQISGNSFTQSEIDLANASETGDGAVTDVQNLCVDGTFSADGVTGCNGSAALSQLTLDGALNSSQTALAALSFLSVTDDFTIDPGTFGSASAGTFTDTFTAGTTTSTVPEPKSTILIAALALGLAIAAKRR
ncbi:MAG TPA: hypothetical protein VKT81_05055 [Bryobacteraceae bacterium]|nr:hypothetical protein [Bryobacteraceae bacterium]